MTAPNTGESVVLKSLLGGMCALVKSGRLSEFSAEIYPFVEKAHVSFKNHQSGLTRVTLLLLLVIISPP